MLISVVQIEVIMDRPNVARVFCRFRFRFPRVLLFQRECFDSARWNVVDIDVCLLSGKGVSDSENTWNGMR